MQGTHAQPTKSHMSKEQVENIYVNVKHGKSEH